MISVEDLLQPISPDEPCGPDLAYDPAFQQLETLLRGKPETQFSAAEDPDWKDLRAVSVEFHQKSKHLTASVILALSLLKTEGLAGLRDGLAAVRGLLERYWDTVHPRLDPEDDNDPTERMNILANLASQGEPYRLIPRLKETAIAQSPSLGRVKLNDILLAKQPGASPAEGQPTPLTEGQIQAIFRDANLEALTAVHDAVTQSLEHVKSLDLFLSEKVGARAANLDELSKSLLQVQSAIAPIVGAPAGEGEAEAGAEPTTPGAAAVAGGRSASPAGAIQSREDVVRALDRICDYYRQFEPSSPVPYILKRAQRLAKMNFMEIVSELTPDAITTVKVVTGTEPGETPAG